MRSASISVFPAELDRTSAIEAIGAQGARIIENLEADERGRLRRRGGLANSSRATSTGASAINALLVVRRDGVACLLDAADDGKVTITVGITSAWNDVDEFGARTTAPWYENFNEDGP